MKRNRTQGHKKGNNNKRRKKSGKKTPLHDAARLGDEEEVAEIVADLERSGCAMAVDARDEHGRTSMHLAAWAGKGAVVDLLLKAGGDTNLTAQDDMTALHFASQSGCAEAARLLLLSGSDVDAKLSKSLRTPLHVAAAKGHVEVVQALVDAGADVAAVTRQNQTALDLATCEPVRTLLLREQNRQLQEANSDTEASEDL